MKGYLDKVVAGEIETKPKRETASDKLMLIKDELMMLKDKNIPYTILRQILIEQLDYVYEIRRLQKKSAGSDVPLWTMSRPTAYRLVKRVMNRAGIVGKQATGKGLRHGFGVAMVTAKKPLPLHVLSQLMGHTDTKTTEIYLQGVASENGKNRTLSRL